MILRFACVLEVVPSYLGLNPRFRVYWEGGDIDVGLEVIL